MRHVERGRSSRGSIFDSGFIGKLEHAVSPPLEHCITGPIMPTDEHSGYLITQAIADYLASQARPDGILYPSAQVATAKKNKNIALFHPSSRVESLQILPNTELSVHAYTTMRMARARLAIASKPFPGRANIL
jgi:RES domain